MLLQVPAHPGSLVKELLNGCVCMCSVSMFSSCCQFMLLGLETVGVVSAIDEYSGIFCLIECTS